MMMMMTTTTTSDCCVIFVQGITKDVIYCGGLIDRSLIADIIVMNVQVQRTIQYCLILDKLVVFVF